MLLLNCHPGAGAAVRRPLEGERHAEERGGGSQDDGDQRAGKVLSVAGGERGRPEEVAGSGGGQVPGRSVRSVDGDRRGEEEHPGSLFSDVMRLKTVT